jgi:hypothetical protein
VTYLSKRMMLERTLIFVSQCNKGISGLGEDDHTKDE